ncbi:hypothetical protein [Candidatus Odyssella acanthamoebae]|uniref:Uncharacterized protein n=1 Tax=Candidatus Odyssella acanthamoebae TaxID=91604 RepID=A0A077AZ34_9PROT|nr:hypothetical protein [Candidatus Paracaedibacter acanthamoebae]AIK96903.1 hypothetical protein ID47_09405 [Candidatus Paracaedibacter acanthamoebae]
MKIKNINVSFIIGSLTFYGLLTSVGWTHDQCGIKELHHHGRATVCLGYGPQLSKEQLAHFFDEHLEKNTKIMYFNAQENLNDNHLEVLSKSKQAATVIELDLMRTKVTYDGIASLWRSPILGSVRDDEAVYEKYYNLPVSVIKVEIGHTPALKSYKEFLRKGKKIFPLPLRKDFEITYRGYTGESSEAVEGFKEIVLLNHGKEIK